MEIKEIVKSVDSILTIEQAVVALVSILKMGINKIKKTSIVKNTIEDFNYDIYLSKFNNINIDENTIKDLVESCDKPIKINELKELLIECFVESGEKSGDAQKLAEIFLTNYFNNINDCKDAALSRIISDIDDIKSSIKNIESKTANIKTIDEIEEELRTNLREGAEIKDFDLRYFEIDDPNFKNKFNEFLSKREEIIISCYSIEEGIYCILNYLKYIKKYYNVYVINDEETWNNLDEKNIEGNILIANFFSRNVYKKYKKVKHVFIYNRDNNFINGETIDLRKRTIVNIIAILEKYYKFSYDEAHKFCIETNGNYYLVKNKIFTVAEAKFDDKAEKNELFSLFLINSFEDSDNSRQMVKKYFDIDYDDVVNGILSKDCYIKYFKKYNRYGSIFFELLDAFSVWDKYRLYKDSFVRNRIIDVMNSITEDFELDNSNIYIGFIKSLIIYKTFNNPTINNEFDNFTRRIISLIKTQSDWNFAKGILDYLVELSPDIIIMRVIDEFNGNKDTGLVNSFVHNKDNHFYIDILWMLEKSFYLINNKKLSFEALFEIFSKNFDYRMNDPKDILRKLVFPGIDSPVDFNFTKKIFDEMIDKYKNIDIWSVFYENVSDSIVYSWNKPKVCYCDDGYVNNIKETWLYCFKKLDELDKDCKKTVDWIKVILNSYHTLGNHKDNITNTINELCKKGDIFKLYLKYNLLQLLYNYNFFDKEGIWDIDEDSKAFIKVLIDTIQFNDKYYDTILYFQNENNYNLIEPIKFNSDNYLENNRDIAAIDKKKYFENNCDLDIKKIIDIYKKLIQSEEVEFEQYNFQLGQDIAEYFDKKEFNEKTFKLLINSFLEPAIFHREIFDYIYSINLGEETIRQIKNIYSDNELKNPKFYIRLLNLIFRINGNMEFLNNESDYIKKEFWTNFDEHMLINEKNHQVAIEVLENLLKYENFSSYIGIVDFNKKLFNFKELKDLISKLSIWKKVEIKNSYALSDLLEYLYINKFDDVRNDVEFLEHLSHIELEILGKFHNCKHKWTQYLFEKNPDIYAKFVINNDYRLENESNEIFVNRILRYNGFIYRLNLNKLNEIEFNKWDIKFKDYLNNNIDDKNVCEEIYYESIGSIIGLSDVDPDGAFPKVHYRKYVENNYNENLFNSIIRTKYSKRGMYSPKQGEYNYSIVEFLNKSIERCNEYKNTRIVLIRLRNQFLDDAERERELSENEEF